MQILYPRFYNLSQRELTGEEKLFLRKGWKFNINSLKVKDLKTVVIETRNSVKQVNEMPFDVLHM